MTARAALLLAAITATAAHAGPVVSIAQGRLSGAAADGVEAFKGIPYAAPPIRDRRWRAPGPAPHWHGVRPATAFGAVCPQAPVTWAGHDLDHTSEDCLFLNVWTPRHPVAGARLPVLVWLHGGGYTAGAGSQTTYDGGRLARMGAVIVTINYRLGVLGYLAHPALSRKAPLGTSGNYGLLDQIAALRWVRANIVRFGGDPANVTVAGQSAGGGSAMLVTVSPQARGLFAKAIFESGAALGLPGVTGSDLKQAEAAGAAFAGRLGATTSARLRALPVASLVGSGAPRQATTPIVDGRIVPSDITAAYRARRDAGVPVLLGWNSDEAARFIENRTLSEYRADTRRDDGAIAPDLLRLYPADDDAHATRAAQDLMSDTGFGWRGWSIAEARAAGHAAPLFLYRFDAPPPGTGGTRRSGAVHSDELGYVWGNEAAPGWPAADQALGRTIRRYWINFMRTGDPNAPDLPRWAPYSRDGTGLLLRLDGVTTAPVLRVGKQRAIDRLLGAPEPDQVGTPSPR